MTVRNFCRVSELAPMGLMQFKGQDGAQVVQHGQMNRRLRASGTREYVYGAAITGLQIFLNLLLVRLNIG